jgi:tetratricopeptide (TPR) repeat protein
LDEILRLKPTNPVPFIAQKAQALTELGKYEAAAEVLDEAEAVHPDANPIKMTRAHLYCEMGRYEDAEVLQRDLMETYPGDAQLKTQLGQTLLWTGKLDEANQLFEEASQTNPMALAQMVNAKHIPEDPKAIEQMAKIADNILVADGPRIAMSFALAEVYDKSKDYDTGFHYLKLANDLTDKTLNYSPEAFNKEVKANKAVYTPEFFDQLSPIRESARTPIFVVGMPRSGTTLTEQILCSHNEVFGAGELDLLPHLTRLIPRVIKSGQPYPICLGGFSSHLREEAARFYLHGLDKLDKDHSYVVDKMPHNFMHVGLIHTIFPKAKIIHIQRDPRDTALSNYQQNFKAKHGGLGYSFNLEKIAHELNSYHEMMIHWRTVLPGRMLEITYEALVADQEAVSREMLEFVGVGWDENVTNFHETKRAVRTASVAQVRQKIYSSSKQKWRRYEKHLTPLLENLNPDLTAPWDKEVSESLETS